MRLVRARVDDEPAHPYLGDLSTVRAASARQPVDAPPQILEASSCDATGMAGCLHDDDAEPPTEVPQRDTLSPQRHGRVQPSSPGTSAQICFLRAMSPNALHSAS